MSVREKVVDKFKYPACATTRSMVKRLGVGLSETMLRHETTSKLVISKTSVGHSVPQCYIRP